MWKILNFFGICSVTYRHSTHVIKFRELDDETKKDLPSWLFEPNFRDYLNTGVRFNMRETTYHFAKRNRVETKVWVEYIYPMGPFGNKYKIIISES